MQKKNYSNKRIRGRVRFEPKESLAQKIVFLPEFNCEMSLFKRKVINMMYNTCRSVSTLVDERIRTLGHEHPSTVNAAAVLDAINDVKVSLFVNMNNVVLQVVCANGYTISINPRVAMEEQLRIAVFTYCG